VQKRTYYVTAKNKNKNYIRLANVVIGKIFTEMLTVFLVGGGGFPSSRRDDTKMWRRKKNMQFLTQHGPHLFWLSASWGLMYV
jgi:hypothetical protein